MGETCSPHEIRCCGQTGLLVIVNWIWNGIVAYFKALSRHMIGETEKEHDEHQLRQPSNRDLDREPREYEAGSFHTRVGLRVSNPQPQP
jgi:hypothetical protein